MQMKSVREVYRKINKKTGNVTQINKNRVPEPIQGQGPEEAAELAYAALVAAREEAQKRFFAIGNWMVLFKLQNFILAYLCAGGNLNQSRVLALQVAHARPLSPLLTLPAPSHPRT